MFPVHSWPRLLSSAFRGFRRSSLTEQQHQPKARVRVQSKAQSTGAQRGAPWGHPQLARSHRAHSPRSWPLKRRRVGTRPKQKGATWLGELPKRGLSVTSLQSASPRCARRAAEKAKAALSASARSRLPPTGLKTTGERDQPAAAFHGFTRAKPHGADVAARRAAR